MKIREIAKQSPLQEGAISNKVLPGLSFADAGIRVAEKDYPGAAIAGTAAGLSLIPTIPTQAASIGLEGHLINYATKLRDAVVGEILAEI